MPSPKQYYQVNWVNGMKITKEHFVQQENAFLDMLKDQVASHLNRYNYGLIPDSANESEFFRGTVKIDNQKKLSVSLQTCRAYTPGGARIDVRDNLHHSDLTLGLSNEVEQELKGDSRMFYIALIIDLFSRKPTGEIEPNVEPARYPDVVPMLSLQLFPEAELSKDVEPANALFIGKMEIINDKLELDQDYIPPCMVVRSYPKMLEFYHSVEKFFGQAEMDLVSIIRKINEKGQDSSLNTSVKELSTKLLDFINRNNLKIKWEAPDQPPLLLFETVAAFSRVIRNTIDTTASEKKEELLNYFTNWSELKQGDFEKLLVSCVNFEYVHYDILNSVEQFEEVIQILGNLFTKLESLAYIGKKKETNIFVKEDKPKRSFLAD